MNTCRSCNHWAFKVQCYPARLEYHECLLSTKMGIWLNERSETEDRTDCLMAYPDLDGHEIYTGPDFGCVHWEPRSA